MHSSNTPTAREVFEQVVALPPTERGAELDRLCAGRMELRQKVERLLAADEKAHTFLETLPYLNEGDTPGGGAEMGGVARAGQLIGRYRVRRLLGSGGMGAVYEAEQDKPQRLVALKVIRPGLMRRDLLRRFEYEAEALARLRHPGVAQIYEAGVQRDHASGLEWPFIAMELVPNAMSLTAHAVEKGLSEAERLRLFAQVCDAVHHAHQRGVIHRDLKPANILVDESGRVRVIDFGVARAADPDVSLTAGTNAGQLIGTLQYMSPEQCSAQSADIDTRTDVYSLGVVLYELVAGALPYNVSGTPALEAARVVRETSPARLKPRAIAEDLEAIVFKALEKEPERRYRSAAELGEDIERYLTGSAVRARPPTLRYQMRTFARRHRAVAVGGTIAAASLVIGVTGTTIGLLRALDERDRSIALQSKWEEEAIRSRRVAVYLRDVLASANPYDFRELGRYMHPESTIGGRIQGGAGAGRSVPPSDILLRAAAELRTRFPNDPLIRAELGTNLGESLTLSGWLLEAVELLRDAHRTLMAEAGPESLTTVRAAEWLAHALEQFEPSPEIVGLREYAVRTRARLQGALHPETLRSSMALVRALGRGPDPAAGVRFQNDVVRDTEGALGGEAAASIEQRVTLALALSAVRADAEAERTARESLALAERACGIDSAPAVYARRALGDILWRMERYEEATTEMDRALERSGALLGVESPAQGSLEMGLAFLLMERREHARALPLARRQLGVTYALHGAGHHATFKMKHMVACCLLETGGDLAEAETLAREAVEGVIGMQEHVRVARYRVTLARIMTARGRAGEAEQLLDVAAADEHLWRSDDRAAQRAALGLARAQALGAQGRREEAAAALAGALEEIPRIPAWYPKLNVPTAAEVEAVRRAVGR